MNNTLPLFIGGLGMSEILLIALVVLLFFGGKKTSRCCCFMKPAYLSYEAGEPCNYS